MPLVITQKDSRPRKHSRILNGGAASAPKRQGGGRAAWSWYLVALRRLGLGACWLLGGGLGLVEYRTDPTHFALLLFVSGLALLAVLVPATGPRGQRVGLIPAVGLAALLLLPPFSALASLLLASAVSALSCSAMPTQRQAWERAACLTLALLLGAGTSALLPKSVFGNSVTAAVYCVVFAAARMGTAARYSGAGRAALRQGRQSGKLEAATLIASAPVALLMAAAFPRFGLSGLAGAAVLLGLLGLVAHFGFEVAGLRGQVSAMEKLSAVTVSQTSAERVTEQFLTLSRGLVSCDRVTLWLTDDTEIRLKRVLGRGGETVSVRFGEGLAGRAAERTLPWMIRDGSCDPRAVPEETSGGRTPFALLLVPLVAGSRTLGVAQFERDAPGVFTHRDSGRLEALASQAAATLANVRAHQDVYSQATTDALTGLFNRRYMQTVLADERRRAERYGHPLSVIMLDVDGFKSYNDTYGHVQGDVLLKTLAGILQNGVRTVDSVGRFGGEEFVVVLPETPADEAFQTAERLRQAVAGTIFPGFADDPELVVLKTISLGVATYPDITQDTQALVTLADNALYRAKRGGRNQTVQAGPELTL